MDWLEYLTDDLLKPSPLHGMLIIVVICILTGLMTIIVVKRSTAIRRSVVKILINKLKSVFAKEQRLGDIRKSLVIQIGGMGFLSRIVDDGSGKNDGSVVYYCSICYSISYHPGKCNEHGFPKPLTKGSSEKLEYYRNKNRHYEGEEF